MYKLDVDFYMISRQVYSIPSKKQAQTMANLKEEAILKQEDDLSKARILSEKIKSDN